MARNCKPWHACLVRQLGCHTDTSVRHRNFKPIQAHNNGDMRCLDRRLAAERSLHNVSFLLHVKYTVSYRIVSYIASAKSH